MFRPLKGVDSPIIIGRIERIYESLKILCVTKLDTTTGMLSSDTETGVRVNCLYHIFSKKSNARNKQTNFDF